ncbi:RHS repeat-associated core domain-containing protein [Achromobacter aloeverae]
MASSSVCSGTPTIRVRDNRGLDVRTLRYNRVAPGDVASQCVERDAFNPLGQPESSQDARFFAQGGASPTLNFRYTPALSGRMLQTLGADAGQAQAFHDIDGRPVWQRDARGTVQQFTRDALGRPVSRTEALAGQAPAVRERWVYGDASLPAAGYAATDETDPRNLNQRGQVVQHYDTAGLLDTRAAGYTVQGAAQRQDRTLLPPETSSDWSGASAADWQAGLTGLPAYCTAWTYNALGRVLRQTDARGHVQRRAYDVAGRKSAGWVQLQGQAEERGVTAAITYAAGGEIETKADANGIATAYTYEPQLTGRVLGIKVSRKQGAIATVLQDLAYTYDPVGNVVGMTDNAAQAACFKNQATTAARAYTYDALYRLLSASGRENAVASGSPDTDNPGPDPVNYRNYSRSYAYDLGGNLIRITPGNGLPNRIMTVALASNRAVSNASATGATPANVHATYFDAAGNANCLDGNMQQPMRWSGLNQLGCLVTVQRSATDPAQNDRESYAYDGDGRRVRKTGFAKASGAWNQADVIYLPGLEIRQQSAGEQLEVMVLDDGARVLNWTAGKPGDIGNRQIRYRYGDRQNSCQIETDDTGAVITQEEYYPYGGTAVWAAASTSEAKYKTIRYSGKERDAAGLYYYGLRYYQPWIGRWINPDPGGAVDGKNLYCMVRNNPVSLRDGNGLASDDVAIHKRPTELLAERILSSYDENTEKLPRNLLHIWVGPKVLPDLFVSNLNGFIYFYSEKGFQSFLFTDSSTGPTRLNRLKARWKSKESLDPRIQIIDIHRSPELEEFRSGEAYADLYSRYKFAIKNKRFAQAADIFRMYALYKFGGVYADVDDTAIGIVDVDVPRFGIFTTWPVYPPGIEEKVINNTPIIAVPRHPVLHEMIGRLSRADLSSKDSEDVLRTTGPFLFTSVLREAYPFLKRTASGGHRERMGLSENEVSDKILHGALVRARAEIMRAGKYVSIGSNGSWKKKGA